MINHFIHYLTREVKSRFPKDPNDKFYAQVQGLKDGFERPMYHITRAKTGPATRVKAGDIIWLFSVLKSPWGLLPPSLDAKFVVQKIEHLDDGRIKFHANKKSRWFSLANASSIINNLKTFDTKGNEQKLQHNEEKPLGLQLESMRQLSNGNDLIIWSDSILKQDYHFISYRIIDGTKSAFKKVQSLLLNEEANVVFWDRFSLPRRLAERREIVDDESLDKYLMKNLRSRSCIRVWGIESPKYSAPKSYSLKEALTAKKLDKYISVREWDYKPTEPLTSFTL